MTGSVRNNFCQRKSLQLLTTRHPNRRSSKTLDQRPRPLEPHPNSGAGIPPPRRALNPRIETASARNLPVGDGGGAESADARRLGYLSWRSYLVLGSAKAAAMASGGGALSSPRVEWALPLFRGFALLRLRLLLPERGIKRSQAKWRRSKEKGIVGFGGQ